MEDLDKYVEERVKQIEEKKALEVVPTNNTKNITEAAKDFLKSKDKELTEEAMKDTSLKDVAVQVKKEALEESLREQAIYTAELKYQNDKNELKLANDKKQLALQQRWNEKSLNQKEKVRILLEKRELRKSKFKYLYELDEKGEPIDYTNSLIVNKIKEFTNTINNLGKTTKLIFKIILISLGVFVGFKILSSNTIKSILELL